MNRFVELKDSGGVSLWVNLKSIIVLVPSQKTILVSAVHGENHGVISLDEESFSLVFDKLVNGVR